MIDNLKLQAKGDTIGVRLNNVEMKSKVRDTVIEYLCVLLLIRWLQTNLGQLLISVQQWVSVESTAQFINKPRQSVCFVQTWAEGLIYLAISLKRFWRPNK